MIVDEDALPEVLHRAELVYIICMLNLLYQESKMGTEEKTRYIYFEALLHYANN